MTTDDPGDERPRKPRARKGVSPAAVREAAFRLLVEEGEERFGVRPLATRLKLDPMTVLHHGGSRETLLRAAADRMLSELPSPPIGGDWRERLHFVAASFRSLAQTYPKGFSAMIRFHVTGPADYLLGEVVYGGLLDAGLPQQAAVEYGLSFYALVIGFSLSEVNGMLRPAGDEEVRDVKAIPPAHYPIQHALIDVFFSIDQDRMFKSAIDAFLNGACSGTSATA